LGAAGDAGGFPGHALTQASEADPVGKFMTGRRNRVGRVSRSSLIHVGARFHAAPRGSNCGSETPVRPVETIFGFRLSAHESRYGNEQISIEIALGVHHSV
jgi:hypothetical protein